ncbi:hypothetical protein LTR28_008734 [Elasticomyces elasticus]|nr:hypothetical protein LTR28_008734 [Elasticomyces elasticus]
MPAEVRLEIYRYALTAFSSKFICLALQNAEDLEPLTATPPRMRYFGSHHRPAMALLRMCKEVYNEAYSVFYHETTFILFFGPDCKLKPHVEMLRFLSKTKVLDDLRKLDLLITIQDVNNDWFRPALSVLLHKTRFGVRLKYLRITFLIFQEIQCLQDFDELLSALGEFEVKGRVYVRAFVHPILGAGPANLVERGRTALLENQIRVHDSKLDRVDPDSQDNETRAK